MNQALLKTICLSSLLGSSVIAHADDGEIFFNESIKHVKPNVIFLLDGSGSMSWDSDKDGDNSVGVDSRMEILKSSLETLFSDSSIKEIRAGIIRFSDNKINNDALWNVQPVIDIDDSSSNDLIDQVSITQNADGTTTLTQPVLTNIDDGWQTQGSSRRSCLMAARRAEYTNKGCGSGSYYNITTSASDKILGYRFNGILLNHSTTADDIKNAYLNVSLSSGSTNTGIDITIDIAENAPYFTENWNVLGSRLSASSASKNSFPVRRVYTQEEPNKGECVILTGSPSPLRCNVTTLVQDKISQSKWKAGNAIAFYLTKPKANNTYWFREQNGARNHLEITANSSIVSDRTAFTNRNQLISQAYTITPYNGTYIGYALYQVARYISNYTGRSSGTGPYHSNDLGTTSPLLEGCQLSHIILMTDGEPTASDALQLATYMGVKTASNCKIYTGDDLSQTITDITNASNAQACAKSFVSWLARVDQSTVFNGANYIHTNTIGFAMPVNGSSSALTYLQDIAKYGKGRYYNVTTKNDLTQAFKEIISDARAADSPSGSGSVTMSAQSRYQQRTEVFYSLYASDAFDYWAGNMKRFGLKYIKTELTDGSEATRPVLVGKDLTTAAMGTDGVIKNDASSFWDNSKNDGGKVSFGGVLGMLMYKKDAQNNEIADPTLRNMLVVRADKSKTPLVKPYSSITTSDLGLTEANAENIRLGLLDFISGYTYEIGGSNTPISYTEKKIGDAAKASVSLINYDCATANDKGRKDINSCETLNQVALLASNDGFIRGYDTATGTALYEIMPSEMLPLLQKLQTRKVLNFQTPRSYGLDGTVVTYLTNNGDYVNGENGLGAGSAYAYISAGRGGKFIYAFNISEKSAPSVAWVISNNSPGFENLGYTWSTPVLGKIRTGGEIIPVLIFAGGYDKAVDEVDDSPLRTSTVGNAIYIVNATTGALITKIQATGMNYAIPSRVALVTDDDIDNEDKQKLVTDIIVGDTGGQLWRFKINNGAVNSLASFSITPEGDNGLIAKLAGTSTADARKFFQTPAVDIQTINDVQTLVIGLGSGDRVHPVSKEVNNRIYLLKYPVDSGLSKLLTEDDLAVVSASGQDQPSDADKLDNGFMVKLTASGEKVVSDGVVVFGHIVFNSYIPTPTDIKTCKPTTGTQRTYNYDTKTGVSLLQTAYEASSISALPPDVTFYCDSAFCTTIASPSQLADGPDVLSKGKNGRDPWTDKNPDGSGSLYIKAGWTDIFNITN